MSVTFEFHSLMKWFHWNRTCISFIKGNRLHWRSSKLLSYLLKLKMSMKCGIFSRWELIRMKWMTVRWNNGPKIQHGRICRQIVYDSAQIKPIHSGKLAQISNNQLQSRQLKKCFRSAWTYLSHCWYHCSGWLRRETTGIGSAVSSAIIHTPAMMYFACLERE